MNQLEILENNNPSIYVASLAHYNDDRLVGKWFDLSEHYDAETLMKSIKEYISELTLYGQPCEEYAIHGTNNIAFDVSEYADIQTFEKIYKIMELQKDHDSDAIEAFFNIFGSDEDLENFEESYQGKYDSEIDYAIEYVNGCYDIQKMLGNLSNYFDYEAFAKDLFYDCSFENGHVFCSI